MPGHKLAANADANLQTKTKLDPLHAFTNITFQRIQQSDWLRTFWAITA